jgi:ribosome biogenesis GTPase
MRGRIVRAQSGFFWVQTEEAGLLECRLRGRLKKERRNTAIAVVGDEVEVSQVAPGEGAIEQVCERQSRFSRQQPGPGGQWKEDVLIANLDLVVIVFALANPPLNRRMLDRFLVVAEYNEIEPLIVFNKLDLVDDATTQAQLGVYEAIGYSVLYVSADTGAGIAELRERLAGRVSVFTGRSGVGKSSLLNAIEPGLALQTGAVSTAVNKGRHTTVVAELLPLRSLGDGYVADTPGIRELASWGIPPEELDWCFREFRPYLGACDFNNCTHDHEPGCAIRAAVEQGALDAERYDSYLRQRANQDTRG